MCLHLSRVDVLPMMTLKPYQNRKHCLEQYVASLSGRPDR